MLLFEAFSYEATLYEGVPNVDFMQQPSSAHELQLEQPSDCPNLMYATLNSRSGMATRTVLKTRSRYRLYVPFTARDE